VYALKKTVKDRVVVRERLPDERRSCTHKFTLFGAKKEVERNADGKSVIVQSDIDAYLTSGEYDDGRLGEVFLSIGKHGDNLKVFDCLMIAVSIGLQYGIPLSVFVDKFKYMAFEPAGVTNNVDIPLVKSIPDYIFRYLEMRFPEVKFADDGGEGEDLSEVDDGFSGGYTEGQGE